MNTTLVSFHISNALTFASLACAVVAIYFLAVANINMAAFMWCMSAIFDNFDGSFARLFKRSEKQKQLGVQLDSFTDLVAFGVLPVFALIAWTIEQPEQHIYISLAVGLFYLMCSLARLAAFNIASSKDICVGLPTTEAAVAMAAIYLLPTLNSYVLFTYTFFISIMMISNFKTPRPNSIVIILLMCVVALVMLGLWFN